MAHDESRSLLIHVDCDAKECNVAAPQSVAEGAAKRESGSDGDAGPHS